MGLSPIIEALDAKKRYRMFICLIWKIYVISRVQLFFFLKKKKKKKKIVFFLDFVTQKSNLEIYEAKWKNRGECWYLISSFFFIFNYRHFPKKIWQAHSMLHYFISFSNLIPLISSWILYWMNLCTMTSCCFNISDHRLIWLFKINDIRFV